MKTTLMVAAISIMLASQAEAQEGGRGGFNPDQVIDRMFENDKNSDGKLAKDEVPPQMSAFFERLDANQDGFVTKEEVQTMMAGGQGWSWRRTRWRTGWSRWRTRWWSRRTRWRTWWRVVVVADLVAVRVVAVARVVLRA